MANPNRSVLELHATYGHDEDSDPADGQTTNIYQAMSMDSDQIDHKYVYGVDEGGTYIELAHYTSVKQVVIQNISSNDGDTFYIDNTTGALIPDAPNAGQHISICDPDVTAGIMLYARLGEPDTAWHLAICGRKD
jgi:hypothetical protein